MMWVEILLAVALGLIVGLAIAAFRIWLDNL